MWKRLRVGIARLLTRGTDCIVVRDSAVGELQKAANELQDYVDRSGALNDSKWIHAWRRVHVYATTIQEKASEAVIP